MVLLIFEGGLNYESSGGASVDYSYKLTLQTAECP